MEIILAGMNIDKTLLDEHIAVLRKTLENLEDSEKSSDITTTIQELLDRNNLTPETLSAAYARISRDPRPVNQSAVKMPAFRSAKPDDRTEISFLDSGIPPSPNMPFSTWIY